MIRRTPFPRKQGSEKPEDVAPEIAHRSEAVPFRFLAGRLHPDHKTLAPNRAHVSARTEGAVHAGVRACSGRRACSHWEPSASMGPRCMPMRPGATRTVTRACWRWRPRCEPTSRNGFLCKQRDQPEVLDGLGVREALLARRAVAKAMLEARAAECVAEEEAEDEATRAQREERDRTTERRDRGCPPTPGHLHGSGVAHHETLDACGL